MVYLVVSVRVKEGKLQEFLGLFKSVALKVREEKGCVQYVSTVDLETGMPPQSLDKSIVTILEKWESMDALQAHLAAPHMTDYFEKEKPLVDELVSMKILKEA